MTFGKTLQQANALVVGANRGIGLGFVQHLIQDKRFGTVFAACRQPQTADGLLALQGYSQLICLPMAATQETSIAAAVNQIQAQVTRLDLVINCVGMLHQGDLQPEKSLRQIDADQLLQYFQINSIPAVLLAKHLQPLFKNSDRSVFANISAKIGSIEDNRLGGWYGYRASKAALNMFLKTIAIEYSRKAPHTTVVALHPGTTATQLSAPFQRHVPPEQLFSVERTVNQLLTIIDGLTESDNGSFFSWDGSRLPW